MAWAYSDSAKTTPVAVPSISASDGVNYFSGQQIFSNTADAPSTSSAESGWASVIIEGGLAVQGNIYGGSVYGAVWNDLADCITVPEDTVRKFGYLYCFDGERYYKSQKYLDDGIIGINSDTAGFLMGFKPDQAQLQIAVAGFVLAYVDEEYPVGTPLTCTENGYLTAVKDEDLAENYHKVIATFWKKEPAEKWGPEGKEVQVNNRMWVKIR